MPCYDRPVIEQRRHVTRINKRNQVTIPAEMLHDLGLAPGDEVEVEEADGKLAVRKAESAWVLKLRALREQDKLPRFSNEELVQLVHEARRERREAAEADDERIRNQPR